MTEEEVETLAREAQTPEEVLRLALASFALMCSKFYDGEYLKGTCWGAVYQTALARYGLMIRKEPNGTL